MTCYPLFQVMVIYLQAMTKEDYFSDLCFNWYPDDILSFVSVSWRLVLDFSIWFLNQNMIFIIWIFHIMVSQSKKRTHPLEKQHGVSQSKSGPTP